MIFFRGDEKSINCVLRYIEALGDVSGLRMNESKSSIYFRGVADDVKARILLATKLKEGQIPFRYLGIPMHSRNLQIAEYRPLVQRLRRSIDNWASRKLTYAGRALLIQFVLYSTMRFWAGIYLFPVGLIAALEKVCRDFLWAGGESSKGKTKIAWEHICEPREGGGLGFKELLSWNKTILYNVLFTIEPEASQSDWTAWIRAYKLRGRSIWEVERRKSDSGSWSRIITIRDEVAERAHQPYIHQIMRGKQKQE